jgi:hypothetical protein
VFANNIIMPYAIFSYIKVIGQFVCYTENLQTRENNPNIHNVEEDNGLSTMSGLQPLTTEVFYAENNFVFF